MDWSPDWWSGLCTGIFGTTALVVVLIFFACLRIGDQSDGWHPKN